MLNWTEIEAAAENEPPPFSIQLSEQSKILILHLLGLAAEGWPVRANVTDIDARDAAVSLAIDEVLTPVSGGDMQYLGTLEGFASSYVFDNIPADYEYLIMRYALRSDANAFGDAAAVWFNDETGAFYERGWDVLTLVGGGLNSDAILTNNELMITSAATAANSNASLYGTGEIVLPYYAASGRIKMLYTNQVSWSAGQANQHKHVRSSGRYSDVTGAIETIEIAPNTGTNWTGNSRIDLYGVRADNA